MKITTFETIPAVIIPNRKIAILKMIFSPKAKFAIGILRDVTDILVKEKIPILSTYTSNTTIILFIESVEDEILSRVKEELKKIEFLEDLECYKSDVMGFAVLPNAYPTVFGERAIIMRETVFKSFIKGVVNHLKIAPQMVLYIIGRSMGESYAETSIKTLETLKLNVKSMLIIESIIKIAEKMFTTLGYGNLEVVKRSIEPLELEYKVYDCIECKFNFEASKRVKSSLVRGVMEGFYTKILSREVECVEEECIALGNGFCRFKIKG